MDKLIYLVIYTLLPDLTLHLHLLLLILQNEALYGQPLRRREEAEFRAQIQLEPLFDLKQPELATNEPRNAHLPAFDVQLK